MLPWSIYLIWAELSFVLADFAAVFFSTNNDANRFALSLTLTHSPYMQCLPVCEGLPVT